MCEWRSAKNLRPDVIGPTPPFAQLNSPTAHTAFAPLSNFDMHMRPTLAINMLAAALVRGRSCRGDGPFTAPFSWFAVNKLSIDCFAA